MPKDTNTIVIKGLIFGCAIAMIGILIPVFTWQGLLKPVNEPLGIWFQRSGSIVVILAVGLEYNLLKLQSNVTISGMLKTVEKHQIKNYTPLYKGLQLIAAVLAIVGTLIWGYGDLVIDKT
jgi:hypothetical protein